MGPHLAKQNATAPPNIIPRIPCPLPESLPEGLPHRWPASDLIEIQSFLPRELWHIILGLVPLSSFHSFRCVNKQLYNLYWDLLEIFDMSKTRKLENENCIEMMTKVGLETITFIGFEYCHFITPAIFTFIATNCANVTTLDLKGTKLLQEFVPALSLRKMKALTTLRIDYMLLDSNAWETIISLKRLKVLSALGAELIDRHISSTYELDIFLHLPNIEVLLIPAWAYPLKVPSFRAIPHLRLLLVVGPRSCDLPNFPQIACHFLFGMFNKDIYIILEACEDENKRQRHPGVSIAWLTQKWALLKKRKRSTESVSN